MFQLVVGGEGLTSLRSQLFATIFPHCVGGYTSLTKGSSGSFDPVLNGPRIQDPFVLEYHALTLHYLEFLQIRSFDYW